MSVISALTRVVWFSAAGAGNVRNMCKMYHMSPGLKNVTDPATGCSALTAAVADVQLEVVNFLKQIVALSTLPDYEKALRWALGHFQKAHDGWLFDLPALEKQQAEENIKKSASMARAVLGDPVDQRVGKKLLHEADDAEQFAAVQLLVHAGVDLNGQDEHGTESLRDALRHLQILHNIIIFNTGVLSETVRKEKFDGLRDVVRKLLGEPVDQAVGQQALCDAACSGNVAAVQLLVHAGVDLNGQDEHGATALHYAVYYGQAAVIKRLLQLGARTDLQNEDGKTASDLMRESKIVTDHFSFRGFKNRKELIMSFYLFRFFRSRDVVNAAGALMKMKHGKDRGGLKRSRSI